MHSALKKMYLFFIFCVAQLWLVQAEFDVMFTDANWVETSDEYIKPGSAWFELKENDYGETTLSSGFEIIKSLPAETMVFGSLGAIGMDGEIEDLGLHLEVATCELIQHENSVAIPILRGIGMVPEDCPYQPGLYENHDYVISSTDGLPDNFPLGNYLLDVKLILDGVLIGHIQLGLQIY